MNTNTENKMKDFYPMKRNSPFWNEKRVFSRHEAYEWLQKEAQYLDNGYNVKGVEVAPNQVYHSTAYMAKAWGWSGSKVKRFLKELEVNRFLTRNLAQKRTILTLNNQGFILYGWPNNAPINDPKFGHNKGRKKNKKKKEEIKEKEEQQQNYFQIPDQLDLPDQEYLNDLKTGLQICEENNLAKYIKDKYKLRIEYFELKIKKEKEDQEAKSNPLLYSLAADRMIEYLSANPQIQIQLANDSFFKGDSSEMKTQIKEWMIWNNSKGNKEVVHRVYFETDNGKNFSILTSWLKNYRKPAAGHSSDSQVYKTPKVVYNY